MCIRDSGYLRADLAGSDGLHLLDGSKYRPWLDYLAAHTIYLSLIHI